MASSEQQPSPMVGLVIVTHGGSGECLLAAAQGLVGAIAASVAVSITLDDSFEQQVSRIDAACARVDSGAGILILADVHGSSPFRASLAMLDGSRAVEIVCGINLADADQAGHRRSSCRCGRWRSPRSRRRSASDPFASGPS